MKQNKKSRTVILTLALVVTFGLGAASFAYFGNNLFSQSATATGGSNHALEIVIEDEICDEDGNCETYGGTVQLELEEAAGLPEINPDMEGLYVSHTADTITLGTGNIEVEVNIEQVDDQEPVKAVSAVHSGPEVVLQLTEATQVYADTTEQPEPSPADFEAGTMVVKRTVEPGDLSSLGRGTAIRAWGIMDGDVLLADVIVIEPIR